MRFAYADPPYIGQAKRHYGNETSYAGEVDHGALLLELRGYDAWALSASSSSLVAILRLPECPEGVRVVPWVKPFASFKPGVNPAYAWEPVITWGGRKRGRDVETVRDWIVDNITLRRGLSGAKPEGFCIQLFEIMGLTRGDDFFDLFPGTGAVTEAWRKFCMSLGV